MRVPINAQAEAGFARRSQSAGGFGNPPRVPILIDSDDRFDVLAAFVGPRVAVFRSC
jgi:hypothetical protein